ncbi:flagellar hook-basal body complex protein [uncultured Clostridium sp.]|uniref:flagellar hook-basal body complex protein n=1 Tax=uncultured Clostridium sp. TaxID=59620 RepID=UPI0025D89578|nr:flagellar hook-basal body complex protein [uncultured Clostridium sp.]
MLRSMYSGISGMKVNQTKLDVIGNNIANVNTTGFKSSRATFSDLLSQNSKSATAPSSTSGGTNSQQVGLGVQLASIDKIMTQGSMQTTNRNLDVAIDGEGYFMVSSGGEVTSDTGIQVSHKPGTHSISSNTEGSISYTRDGAFIRDSEGNLLSSDGYRVLGYSLTNDDSSMAATAISPDAVNIGSLVFSFGAGSQLNGYNIQIGTISAGTVTSATIENNTIIINGDFTEDSTLNTEQIEKAISKALAAKGISQTINVGGTVPKYSNVASAKKISGGTDAAAPDYVKLGGLKIYFSKGDTLNGYHFEITDVSAQDPTAEVDVDNKTIKVSGNFVDGKINNTALLKAINEAIEGKLGVKDAVSKVDGSVSFTGLKSEVTGTAKESKAPTLSQDSIAGIKIALDPNSKGAGLNNYTIKLKNNLNSEPTVTFSNKTFVISGDLSKIKQGSNIIDDLNTKIKNILKQESITDVSFSIDSTSNFTASLNINETITIQDGVTSTSAGNVSVGGFKLELPTADELKALGVASNALDGYTFKIADINVEDTTVKVQGKEILISGNFAAPRGVESDNLQRELNKAIKDSITNGIDVGVKISNDSVSNKVYSNSKSEEISGGSLLQQGDSIEAFGFSFTPTSGGASLNGYSIEIGNICNQKGVDAKIDTDSKKIIINADFVNGKITETELKNAINTQISNSTLGSNVSIDVKSVGDLPDLADTMTENVSGGTSVQSLATDGTINFVDGNSTVYAYDGSLKTLKIPETVMKNGVAVAVQDYSISSNGVINVTLADQSIAAIGQIAMASFSNPAGLESIGGNLFTEGVNSGTATIKSGINTIEDDNSSAYGSNLSGYLEMSNVDLAEQFTDMIVTTKAFQGSSKMITTGDEILSEIINLKR